MSLSSFLFPKLTPTSHTDRAWFPRPTDEYESNLDALEREEAAYTARLQATQQTAARSEPIGSDMTSAADDNNDDDQDFDLRRAPRRRRHEEEEEEEDDDTVTVEAVERVRHDRMISPMGRSDDDSDDSPRRGNNGRGGSGFVEDEDMVFED